MIQNVLAKEEKMRTGYTTGSCATAAACAALLSIKNQEKITSVDILLPRRSYITIPVLDCRYTRHNATCTVIKDGGDDPDVTHGAEIIVELTLTDDSSDAIHIDGGRGVGIVTKPGLGLEIDKPAINPVPKKMIEENLRLVAGDILKSHSISLVITVPKGEELAPKTDNPRLGIVNGISILGTSGIVIPFSTASYAASIRQNLDVAVAMNEDTVVLTTGGRSEEMARKIIKLPEHCFVQMGDFSGYTIQQCNKKKIKKAYIVGFIGKLAKMAAGVKQTHVKGSKVNMGFLAELAKTAGASDDVIAKVRRANTARHVSEIITGNGVTGFFELVCSNTHRHMSEHSENNVIIDVILFGFDGSILARKK